MSSDQRDCSSDDEIFFGKITLKEVKKRLFWHSKKKPCTASASNSPRKCENFNSSLKILETHSEPDLLSRKDTHNQKLKNINLDWNLSEDDSFIKLENMVERLCVSPTLVNSNKNEELNNTLEVIEYILNNPPSSECKSKTATDNVLHNLKNVGKTDAVVLNELYSKKVHNTSPQKTGLTGKIVALNLIENTPLNIQMKESEYKTPVDIKPKLMFKTPAQKLFATPFKKTPSKSNAYQHITSPVASYIKNCPTAPLLKDVHPKKPLPGLSHIPKLKNHVPVVQGNKENINLPPVAYKSAKHMQVIDLSDEQRLPQSRWANKIMPSVQRPLVVKHDHRQLNFAKKKPVQQQEHSFADLADHQAEISVCIQKSAFKTHKN